MIQHTEIYSLLFIDNLYSNICFILRHEMIFHAMIKFNQLNQYSNILILHISIFAYFISLIINYYFGIICFNIFKNNLITNNVKSKANAKILELQYFPYNIIIAFLSIISIYGNLIILLTGFYKLPMKKIISLALFMKYIYYILYIY